MQRAGEDLRYGLGYVSLFVQHGVAYHPVAFRLFYRAYDDAALLSEQLGRAFGVICAYLDDDLRPCPLVVAVEYACRVELGIDIEENDIPVDLEHVGESGGGYVDQGEHRLLHDEVRAVSGEELPGLVAERPLPVLAVHGHNDFSGLAAYAGQQGLGAAPAGSEQQDCQ